MPTLGRLGKTTEGVAALGKPAVGRIALGILTLGTLTLGKAAKGAPVGRPVLGMLTLGKDGVGRVVPGMLTLRILVGSLTLRSLNDGMIPEIGTPRLGVTMVGKPALGILGLGVFKTLGIPTDGKDATGGTATLGAVGKLGMPMDGKEGEAGIAALGVFRRLDNPGDGFEAGFGTATLGTLRLGTTAEVGRPTDGALRKLDTPRSGKEDREGRATLRELRVDTPKEGTDANDAVLMFGTLTAGLLSRPRAATDGTVIEVGRPGLGLLMMPDKAGAAGTTDVRKVVGALRLVRRKEGGGAADGTLDTLVAGVLITLVTPSGVASTAGVETPRMGPSKSGRSRDEVCWDDCRREVLWLPACDEPGIAGLFCHKVRSPV